MVAGKVATMKRGGDRGANQHGTRQTANLPTATSNAQAAKLLNVSERSVRAAKQIAAKGEPEVAAAVEAGKMTLNEASKVVQLRPEIQRTVANLPKEERRETLKGNSGDEALIAGQTGKTCDLESLPHEQARFARRPVE